MHETLVFREEKLASSPGAEVEAVMNSLAVRMTAFRRSVEYVQDYIDLAGLKIWQEELSRVVYYNIEQVRPPP
jgi:WASH complex subunit strumpellin